MNARVVTKIPPTITQIAQAMQMKTKLNTAGYGRVSTNEEEQLNSYQAQVDYYTNMIQSNPDWNFCGVYADEGISGTSTKGREQFNRMIEDALAGKLDLIITKSVSRFARNTVDSLQTIRKLKEAGCEVYFEKENIWTFDGKGELLLTIMSSLAQEESRSLSENITWGQRRRFEAGKVSMPYKRFLGYEKGADGQPQIVESEAAVVRLIYRMYLQGRPEGSIARHLTAKGVLTPGGKTVWQDSTVRSILQNEKYAGNATLQKTYCADFLEKRMVKNEGQLPKFYVENSHPGIVTTEEYDLVQAEIRRRKAAPIRQSSVHCFSAKIFCAECSGAYGSKVWHSTSPHRKVVWQCNRKYKDSTRCQTPHLYEEHIKTLYIKAFNQIYADRAQLAEDYEIFLDELADASDLDRQEAALTEECAGLAALAAKAVDENARTAQDQDAFWERYNGLVARHEAAQEKLAAIAEERMDRKAKRDAILRFLADLEQAGPLAEFNEALWHATVESVTIGRREATFKWRECSETAIPLR